MESLAWLQCVNGALKGRREHFQLIRLEKSFGPFCRQLFFLHRGEVLPELPGTAKNDVLELQYQDFEELLAKENPEALNFVLLDGEHPVGRLVIEEKEGDIEILNFVMLPQCRNRGLGGDLVLAMQEAASSQKNSLSIVIFKDNPSLDLFVRKGFTKQPIADGYLRCRWS